MVYQDTNSQFQEFSQDDEKNKEQTNNNTQQPSSGAAPSAPAPTAPTTPIANAAIPQRQGSGRFANIQKYVKANQGGGQQIGQKLESSVQKESDKIREGIQSSQQQFQQNVQKTQEDINKANQYAQQLQQQGGAESLASAENDFQNFRNIYTGQVQNPNENVSQFQTGVNKIQNISTLPFTEQGRNQLLAEFSAGPEKQYTGGQRRFDQLLVQSDPNVTRRLQSFGGQKAQEAASNLNTNLEQQKSAIQQTKDLAAIKQQALQQSIGDFGTDKGGAFGGLYGKLEQQKIQAKAEQDAQIKELQDALKSGQIDLNTAKKYGISSYLDLGDEKIQDLVAYAPEQLQNFKSGNTELDALLKEQQSLNLGTSIYTDPARLKTLQNRSKVVQDRINALATTAAGKKSVDQYKEMADIARFGATGVNDELISKYYDQLTSEFVKANPVTKAASVMSNDELQLARSSTGNQKKYFDEVMAYDGSKPTNWNEMSDDQQRDWGQQAQAKAEQKGRFQELIKKANINKVAREQAEIKAMAGQTGALANIDKLREADAARKSELMDRYNKYSKINLSKYLKPEDLANIAQNVSARDADITMADVAKEEDNAKLTALMKLAGRNDIFLGEKQGQYGANFDFAPTQQNIKDQIAAQIAAGGASTAFDAKGKKRELFDKDMATLGLAFGMDPVMAGLIGSANQFMYDTSGKLIKNSGEGSDRFKNYINPLTSSFQSIRDMSKIASKAESALKKLNPFCFAAGNKFTMADGSIKNVEDIKINDIMMYGGKVSGIGQVAISELYDYKGFKVSGSHAVFENDNWIRVENSPNAKIVSVEETIVYPIVNEFNLMISGTEVFADMNEVENGQLYSHEERLDKLNEIKHIAKAIKDELLKIEILPYNHTEYYNTLTQWWKAHSWDMIPQKYFPKHGRIAKINGKNIAAGFMFLSDSNISVLDFIVADKNATKEERKLAVDAIIKNLKQFSLINGYDVIYCYTKHPSVIDSYKNNDFKIMQTEMTTMAYTLNNLDNNFLAD